MSAGKGMQPRKGYNQAKYAENYDGIFRRKGTEQPTQPMKTPEQEQPTVLPWHWKAAKEILDAQVYGKDMQTAAAIISRHDPAPQTLVEKKIAYLQAQHAETLRLLREADEVLCDVSRYPVASAYPDGPCLERETHDNVCKLLIAIRAHLAAMQQSAKQEGSQ